MVYLEELLRQNGIQPLSHVSILTTSSENWVYRDLQDELLDVFPQARVQLVGSLADLPATELLVVPFADRCQFPLEDVVYRRLDVLRRLLPSRKRLKYVLLYRCWWRDGNLVPARRLLRHWARRHIERAAIRILSRSPLMRKVFAPLY